MDIVYRNYLTDRSICKLRNNGNFKKKNSVEVRRKIGRICKYLKIFLFQIISIILKIILMLFISFQSIFYQNNIIILQKIFRFKDKCFPLSYTSYVYLLGKTYQCRTNFKVLFLIKIFHHHLFSVLHICLEESVKIYLEIYLTSHHPI